MVSGHWETDGFAFTGADRPELIYDYRGFPPHTYALEYAAPGAPALAAQAAGMLAEHGIKADVDAIRGFDHGVFVPLKVAFPNADIPVVECRSTAIWTRRCTWPPAQRSRRCAIKAS